ncbi:hypothetical protein GLOIN_2v1598257 [Rhizophagus irregularis DAOM 181602=DAOM 197198]|nr:hypothetical protein GLOIN_2v1598257 [Rhizophagus irregularis DAOM 181602=DAOM 197198]GET59218.1 hypothetical protein GLOIN_2v1598257 [Rhizophagus irregularis DAOM 181602=DAOM 197198]
MSRDSINLNSSALCPLCNRDHKEKSIWNNINDEWGSGEYYRERTYRLKISRSSLTNFPNKQKKQHTITFLTKEGIY